MLSPLLRRLRTSLARASLRLAGKLASTLIAALLRRLAPAAAPHGAPASPFEPAMARARAGNRSGAAPRGRTIDGDARRVDDPRASW